MAVLPLRLTVSVLVASKVLPFCVVAELYKLNVTVSLLLALTRPVTVAVSDTDVPTVAVAGVWLVLIDGVVAVSETGSAVAPLVTTLLLLSPLKVATQ